MRRIYVPQEIRDRINNDSKQEGFPAIASDRLSSTFWAGYYVSISLIGDPEGAKPDLERLHSVDEVWAICFRRVRNDQWRLLGRFAAKSIFVGLKLYRRSQLAGSEYSAKAEEVIFEWATLYGLNPPLVASHKSDYLSGVVGDVDVD